MEITVADITRGSNYSNSKRTKAMVALKYTITSDDVDDNAATFTIKDLNEITGIILIQYRTDVDIDNVIVEIAGNTVSIKKSTTPSFDLIAGQVFHILAVGI